MLVARRLTYQPPAARRPIWPGLDFDTGQARCVLLSGDSGTGKSTLLRLACGLLPGFRGGCRSGELFVAGRPAPATPGPLIGMVCQNPEAMLHSPRVRHELQSRLPDGEALTSPWVAALIETLGLADLLDRRIVELSGGQQQRLALAAVLMSRPRVVLLDEPTSNLDPDTAAALARLLGECLKAGDMRLLIAEHNAAYVRTLADGAIRLEPAGATAWNGTAGTAPANLLPPTVDYAALAAAVTCDTPPTNQPPVLRCTGVSCRRGGRSVLRSVDLELRQGEIVGLCGPNGSGKSTLLLLLAGGLGKPERGRITWLSRPGRGPRVGLLLQNPLHQLFCDTVRQEVAFAAENYHVRDVDRRVGRLLEAADLTDIADRMTLALSYGQQQRTALAAAMSAAPPVVLLDEPTHGMDARRLLGIMRFVGRCRRRGTAFVIASHDLDMLRAVCDRVLRLEDGCLVPLAERPTDSSEACASACVDEAAA